MADKLNVSLEPHLRDVLAALLHVLPEETSQQLAPCLSSETSTTVVQVIPYELILKISRWCRTADGRAALQACSPPLDPQSYTMISLLAGTRTSPEKHFPPYAAKDPEEDQRLLTKDRKAIATLVNAVLSVITTGVATWWASGHTGMRLEWVCRLVTLFSLWFVRLTRLSIASAVGRMCGARRCLGRDRTIYDLGLETSIEAPPARSQGCLRSTQGCCREQWRSRRCSSSIKYSCRRQEPPPSDHSINDGIKSLWKGEHLRVMVESILHSLQHSYHTRVSKLLPLLILSFPSFSYWRVPKGVAAQENLQLPQLQHLHLVRSSYVLPRRT